MTIEEKKQALYEAVNSAWEGAFDGWKQEESEDNPNIFVLGEKTGGNGFAFFLMGCEDIFGGLIWVEYEPEKDMVGIYVKYTSIQAKFKEDLEALFEKYSPFNMTVSYKSDLTPVISRQEKVEPKDFTKFFKELKKAYDEYYPLFYMFTVSAKKWYDGFCIEGSDC